jgi:single-strand DNA-binding protein
MQFISITGRVGGDAETRTTQSSSVTSFSCAVDQGFGDRKQTNWYRVSIWGDRGTKLAGYIKKGEKVAVTGELIVGEYNGKTQLEIRSVDIDCFMSGKPTQGAGTNSYGQTRQEVDADLDTDVPF